uniref:protein adenylyltransferase SelO family protein n=1 Tax=Agarivorans sp. TaxID=1872412 RepID=UPI003CFBF707
MEFVNRFAQALPELCHQQPPTPLSDPQLVIVSEAASQELALEADFIQTELAEITAGQRTLSGMQPVASVYAGHQFGGYSPQL